MHEEASMNLRRLLLLVLTLGLSLAQGLIAQELSGTLRGTSGETKLLFRSAERITAIALRLENHRAQCDTDVVVTNPDLSTRRIAVGLFDSSVIELIAVIRMEVEFGDSALGGA
jgi:hypothetical protein